VESVIRFERNTHAGEAGLRHRDSPRIRGERFPGICRDRCDWRRHELAAVARDTEVESAGDILAVLLAPNPEQAKALKAAEGWMQEAGDCLRVTLSMELKTRAKT
jgi:hypothetical protein